MSMIPSLCNIMSFRFSDLPPEIKDQVYGFYAADILHHSDKQLARLRSPPLAQVSPDIRKDFLAIFFAESAFEIIVGPRYPRSDMGREYRGAIDGVLKYESNVMDRTMRTPMDVGDPIYLQRPASLLINQTATFHNISFELHQLRTRSRRQQWGWREFVFGVPQDTTSRRYVAVKFQWSKGQLAVQQWPENSSQAPPDAPRLFQRTIRVARKLTTRKDFKGFTVHDLRLIAISMVADIER